MFGQTYPINCCCRGHIQIKCDSESEITDFSGVGIGEEIHKEMDSPQAEALVIRRKRLLQLLIID